MSSGEGRPDVTRVEARTVELDAPAGYELWSSTYDGTDNPLVALASHAFTSAHLPLRGARFADLGCGTGRILQRALEAGAAHVLGVDGSPAMLEIARGRLGSDASVTLHLARLQGPWPAPLVAAAPADVACCMLVLEHFVSPLEPLRLAAHLVRPGGVLWLAELHVDLAEAGTGAHFEVQGVRYQLPTHPHPAVELSQALHDAGFEVVAEQALIAAEMVDVHPKLRKHGSRRALQVMQAVRCDDGCPATRESG